MNGLTKLLGMVLLAASPAAFAIPITTVGGADTLVDWGNVNSGDANEKKFIADYLGVTADAITYTKLASSGGSAWQAVDGDPSLYAFNFGGATPALFLIKTGAGVGLIDSIDASSPGTFTHYLFRNDITSLFWGVVDFDIFTRTQGQIEIGMVSHVATSGTTPVKVPEPTALSLLSFGLLVIASRFRRRSLRQVA